VKAKEASQSHNLATKTISTSSIGQAKAGAATNGSAE